MLLTNQSVGQSVKHITLNKSIKGGGEESKIPIIKVLHSLFSLLPSFFLLSWLAICIVFFATVLSFFLSFNSSLGCHAMSSPP